MNDKKQQKIKIEQPIVVAVNPKPEICRPWLSTYTLCSSSSLEILYLTKVVVADRKSVV